MYGTTTLKPTIAITDQTVECPCSGCTTVVQRARRGQPLRQQAFFCREHKIFISPSTFEHEDEGENLLWRDPAEQKLLASVKRFKRESRLARDNSEDALTWNVFRYLEKTGQLSEFLSSILDSPVKAPAVSYWSCSISTDATCESLASARSEFGETPERSSEPDVIIEADGMMIWVEAKLGSTNDTTPSNPNDTKGYLTGGDGWFCKAFTSDYSSVAVTARRYELMRLWLLGTWAANTDNSQFYLINLVPESRRESAFLAHISTMPHAQFACATWEQLYRWVNSHDGKAADGATFLRYMREKSAGYRDGQLVSAFPTLVQTM